MTGLYSGPYFDLEEMKIPREFLQNGGDVLSGRTNITTQIGSSAVLPCVVKQVGSNTVRAILHPKLEILAFTSLQISIIHFLKQTLLPLPFDK